MQNLVMAGSLTMLCAAPAIFGEQEILEGAVLPGGVCCSPLLLTGEGSC